MPRWYGGNTKHSDHKALSRPCSIRHDSALKKMANFIVLLVMLCHENFIAIASLCAVVCEAVEENGGHPAPHSGSIDNL